MNGTNAKSDVLASLLLPGLGQLLQGRRGTALNHFAGVVCFATAAGAFAGWPGVLLAAGVNAWSCYEAARWRIRESRLGAGG